MKLFKTFILGVFLLTSNVLNANEIAKWTDLTLQAIRMKGTPPPIASRNLALVQVSMFDSINSIQKGYEAFAVKISAHPDLVSEVAIAKAAHDVLTTLYPEQASLWSDNLRVTMASHPDGPKKNEAVTLGTKVAETIMQRRQDDVKDHLEFDFVENLTADIGVWVPTPPKYLPGLLPHWGKTRPFVMLTGDQFRQAGPPPFYSHAYARDYDDVRNLGGKDSELRTNEQTEIALFWEDGAGTITPPGHWNKIALAVAKSKKLALLETSRLMTLLNLAMADSAVSAWDMKYFYNCWRPWTAIEEADRDNNDQTTDEQGWESLLTTPPFPDYVSGHSTFSGSAAAILAGFFGTDQVAFVSDSEGLPGVKRSFKRFSQAAEEAGRSRIYGGIHYEFANRDGLTAGRQISEFILSRTLLPIK